MNKTTVVHLIANAHLDPVWLWPWQAGIDEALATCRSACDRLDTHSDLIYTRGEAWVYAQIERLDPVLFERIKAHVISGQWEIVGGWWVQPDCNFPSAWGLRMQIELGREYFESRFGVFPKIAYNVDSFGHTANLPTILRAASQTSYIMMRPQEHEMALPSRVFRWREADGSPEVTTFRIASGYTCRDITVERVLESLGSIPEGLGHTMCFYGVGDHGGGPTEAQIAWCRSHANSIPGATLTFSSPSNFFEAIAPKICALPVVTGELQQHAIGCYSVHRPIKTAVRRAEHLLEQARFADPAANLTEPWKRVCFAHFHDTLGGTAIPSAYPAQLDILGYSAAICDETLQYGFRDKIRVLPADTRQRIVAFNPSDSAFHGYLEFEPWLDWHNWDQAWWVSDVHGDHVPIQRVHSESLAVSSGSHGAINYGLPRLLFAANLGPGEICSWNIERTPLSSEPSIAFNGPEPTFSNDSFQFAYATIPLPRLALIEDLSDTWSHGKDRYDAKPIDEVRFASATLIDDGPLMRSWFTHGMIGASRWWAEWRSYHDQPYVELRLRVHWQESHKLLKLVLPQADESDRVDGITGSHLIRPNDGRELPFRDWTANKSSAIVAPDVFGLDASPDRIRLTLLRSPLLAHHDPHDGVGPRGRFADQGEHEFRFQFFVGPVATETLDVQALQLHRPPLLADLTRGMVPGEKV